MQTGLRNLSAGFTLVASDELGRKRREKISDLWLVKDLSIFMVGTITSVAANIKLPHSAVDSISIRNEQRGAVANQCHELIQGYEKQQTPKWLCLALLVLGFVWNLSLTFWCCTGCQHCSTHSAQCSQVQTDWCYNLGMGMLWTLQGKHASAAALLTWIFNCYAAVRKHTVKRKGSACRQVHWPSCT